MTLVDRIYSAMTRHGSSYAHPFTCRCPIHRRLRALARKLAKMEIPDVGQETR